MNKHVDIPAAEVITLLKELIGKPSFSKEEEQTAAVISNFLDELGIGCHRLGNNIFALNRNFDPSRPSILLNSHHDTVRPNAHYTRDPYQAIEEDGKLYGLGSNDAGGSLVSLIGAFAHFYRKRFQNYNLVIATTAEEEISGTGGIESVLRSPVFLELTGQTRRTAYANWCAIVGEPTNMQMAVAEKGLLVLDCRSKGHAGHAAREEGVNAIYSAMDDIKWFREFQFPKVSELLGPVKMSVTVIETDNQSHNIVPADCHFVVDARINELYSFEEIIAAVQSNVRCSVVPRSKRLRSTMIPLDHPLVKAGLKLGRTYFGSPTTSDKSLIPFHSLKIGPGDSARSHTADEYIYVREIEEGMKIYIELLNQIL